MSGNAKLSVPLLLLAAVLMLSVCGCGNDSVYDVNYNGTVYDDADDDDGGKFGIVKIFGIILILGGAVNVAAPRATWYLAYGWIYKDAEPSALALFAERAGGVLAIIVGIVFLFI